MAKRNIRKPPPIKCGPSKDKVARYLYFAQEYLIDENAAAAAKRTGYSAKSAHRIGWQMLQRPEVQAYITARREELKRKLEVTQERIIAEYAKIAFSDPTMVAVWGPHGLELRSSEQLPNDARAAVQEVGETRTKDGGSIKFKLHDKKGALDSLARVLGMFKDQLDLKTTFSYQDIVERAAKRAEEIKSQAQVPGVTVPGAQRPTIEGDSRSPAPPVPDGIYTEPDKDKKP